MMMMMTIMVHADIHPSSWPPHDPQFVPELPKTSPLHRVVLRRRIEKIIVAVDSNTSVPIDQRDLERIDQRPVGPSRTDSLPVGVRVGPDIW